MLPSELECVQHLLERCYRWLAELESWRDEELEAILKARAGMETIAAESQSQAWLVAVLEEEIVGIAAIADNEIARLYVNPGHHRQGIGTQLFHTARTTIESAGHSEILLGSAVSAVSFYEAMGMSVVRHKSYTLPPLADRIVYVMTGPAGRARDGQATKASEDRPDSSPRSPR